ncbi:MAG: hypothetical protein NTY64_08210 [Deltaproteobacteria bacterium]|nr:hypothetical protein [Deltaproteobacteria bacterium]
MPIAVEYRSSKSDGFVKSPTAALRFTFVAAAYHPSTPHSSGFARRVPRNAGELFTKPSLWRLFTKSSLLAFPNPRGPAKNGGHDQIHKGG